MITIREMQIDDLEQVMPIAKRASMLATATTRPVTRIKSSVRAMRAITTTTML